MTHSAVDVIRTKRDGGVLADDAIRWFMRAYTAGEVADEQAAALCMAIFWRGMTPPELAAWTKAMIDSGTRLDLSGVGRPTVDKHSTGGVGDKVSLILVPLVAACGAAVPQLSGRGLGHTGGTLDKMEAIRGWRAGLSATEMVDVLRSVGGVIAAAGDDLAPADRKLYALRDVTSTVESIPLIASSIMSKKIAEGTGALVLDVKFGSGAFLPDPARGRELAETMVALGEAHGVRTAALQTSMETVLGHAAGNALEVTESVEILAGGGPADVVEITVALAREMLALAGLDQHDPATVLAEGRAMPVWREMVVAQGGDPDEPLAVAPEIETVVAARDGVLTRLDARAVGVCAWRLGAGRSRKEDPVSASAGVVCRKKPGDTVRSGDVLLELHIDDPARVEHAREALVGAYDIGDTAPPPSPLILDRIGTDAAYDASMTRPTLDEIRAAPKVLLHDHLDGGLRPSTIVELAESEGYDALPTKDPDELSDWMTRGANRSDLVLYLETFVHTVGVMQSRDSLIRVARECAEDLAADGVVYAEVRFAPELHIEKGLSLDEVVEAVLEGFRQGSEGRGITVRVLCTAMRTAALSLQIAELAVRWRDEGVCGFDIAGAEAGYPPTRHLDVFQYVMRENFHITIHAGEAFGLPSIWEALQFCGAERLGHGVRIVDDIVTDGGQPKLGRLANYVRDLRVPLEMCPSSNVHSGAARSIEEHPIGLLSKLRFRVTVNTDNRLMSHITVSEEFAKLVDAFDWGWEEIRWATINGMKSAFYSFDQRLHIINGIIKPWYAERLVP